MRSLVVVASAVFLTQSPGTAASQDGAANLSEHFSSNSRDCIANTGAFCVMNCDSSRGPGYCHWGRCFCNENACAGVDQICHTGDARNMNYPAGVQHYRIRNARWPDYHLYASAHGPLTARTWYADSAQTKWTLKSPPDFDPNRAASYLISSVQWRDAVMIIEEDEACIERDYCNHGHDYNNVTGDEIENHTLHPNNTNMSLPEGYFYQDPQLPTDPQAYDDPENFNNSLDLSSRGGRRLCVYQDCDRVQYPLTRYVQGNWLKWGADPPIADMLMTFERAPLIHQHTPDHQLVLIKNFHNSYLYMPTWGMHGFAGWGTRAYPEDPGAGGYWFFDPPLPQDVWNAMPSYSGPTCDLDCGKVGDIQREMTFVNGAQELTCGFAALLSLGAVLALVH